MIQTPESEKTMSSTTPSSLASVAHAKVERSAPTSAQGTGLEARGIHAWFGKNHVLSNINLDFAAGSVTALIGPSGCGKSTFLRLLNRMHEFIPRAAMAGEVLFAGNDIYDPGVNPIDIRRRIGMVFQKPNPFPAMNIGENVVAGLKLSRVKTSNKDALIEDCLTRAGLWKEVKDRLGSAGGSLSGGQQQRLTIARALSQDPELLMLDEFSIAVDPVTTMRIEDVLKELKNEITIILVTNLVQQARRLADRTAFFLDGKCLDVGVTEDLFTGEISDQRTRDYVEGRFG